jgi:hypothetical protein
VIPQIDTTKSTNPDSININENEKQNNFFQQEELKLKDLGKNLHQRHLELNLNIPQFDYEGFQYMQPDFDTMFNEDQLKGFKDSYSFLMKSEYKNLFKYDLGVVGKYLGISENIMAIILAIISVAK